MLKKVNTRAKIVTNKKLAPDCYQLELCLEDYFPPPQPGQFALLRLLTSLDPLLGRPLSIYSFDPANQKIGFVYRVVGRGTAILAGRKKGEEIGLFGPLGRPFSRPEQASRLLIVAGGIGAAALNLLVREQEFKREIICYLGVKTAQDWIAFPPTATAAIKVNLTTEDGSAGARGLITDFLARDLPRLAGPETQMYACGPRGMLARLARLLADYPLPCQVSLEERMACGVGACLGCAVQKAKPELLSYARVCCDGPVFDIGEVTW